jgi:hypothetical protein
MKKGFMSSIWFQQNKDLKLDPSFQSLEPNLHVQPLGWVFLSILQGSQQTTYEGKTSPCGGAG